MPSNRWEQVSQIFEGALALRSDEREAYVEAQCGSDGSLRREVESLIQAHLKAEKESFIEQPAAERAAPVLTADEIEEEEAGPQLEKGDTVGYYEVVEKIGAGGMGEVYRANDPRLNRVVALKILPADVASDHHRMLRFKQEARSVSSLNHPNILTIFEFGETDSLSFIATEYIEGDTLRRYLKGRQVKLSEILDIAIQVVAALDAAHEAKIVHRDIKPENIMIRRRDQLVKVLDFGLARQNEKGMMPGHVTDTEAKTEMLLQTLPGSLLGTVNYMSPEQAQGLRVDQRSDIWSLGVVLYEMVAGQIPFSGPTGSHTVVAILEKEPATLGTVPSELERIVRKTLAKNVDERYQTAKDLLIDLKNLRRRLELEAEIERSGTSLHSVHPSPTTETNQTADHTSHTKTQPQAPAGAQTVPEQSYSRVKRVWLPVVVSAGVLILLLVVGLKFWRSPTSGLDNAANAPITTSGAEREISYWLTVQKYRDGRPFENPFSLAGEMIFEKDYQVRLNVKSPQAGYLYILNESPVAENNLSILFPSPTTNVGSAFVSENKSIVIPEPGWFRFDDKRGVEKVWLVWSANTVPELELVRKFANQKDQGLISDSDLSRTTKAFIDGNSVSKPSVEKNDDQKDTTVRSAGMIVHLIKLEHY